MGTAIKYADVRDRVSYFQRTSENVHIRVLRRRRICDIHDSFASCINLLTYLLTYLLT